MGAVGKPFFYFRSSRIDTSPHLLEQLRYRQSLVLRKTIDNL